MSGWGGRYAILAGHKDFSTGPGQGVDAVYACHPSLVAVPADFEPIAVPTSLALGGADSLLGEKEVGQIQELMAQKKKEEGGLETEVMVYDDQVHGYVLSLLSTYSGGLGGSSSPSPLFFSSPPPFLFSLLSPLASAFS